MKMIILDDDNRVIMSGLLDGMPAVEASRPELAYDFVAYNDDRVIRPRRFGQTNKYMFHLTFKPDKDGAHYKIYRPKVDKGIFG